MSGCDYTGAERQRRYRERQKAKLEQALNIINGGIANKPLRDGSTAITAIDEWWKSAIDKGVVPFLETGAMLLYVRDQQLYLEFGYKTFEDCCRALWGISLKAVKDYEAFCEAAASRNGEEEPAPEALRDGVVSSLRRKLDRWQAAAKEWATAAYDLATEFFTSRQEYSSDKAFSHWLAENELDDVGKSDWIALIRISERPELSADHLEDTGILPPRLIWKELEKRIPALRDGKESGRS